MYEILYQHMYFLKIYFIKKFFFYLAASGLSCGMWNLSLQCVGSSLRRAGFSLVVAHGL